jgi:hypothetical protein
MKIRNVVAIGVAIPVVVFVMQVGRATYHGVQHELDARAQYNADAAKWREANRTTSPEAAASLKQNEMNDAAPRSNAPLTQARRAIARPAPTEKGPKLYEKVLREELQPPIRGARQGSPGEAEAAEALCKQHPNWQREVCELVAAHGMRLGMNAQQLRLSWGEPNSINETQVSGLISEQWVYRESGTYVYLTNGVVTSRQREK